MPKTTKKTGTRAAAKSEAQALSEKIEKLDELIDWFYSDEFELYEAPENYKKAMQLADAIEEDLDKLRNTFEKVEEDFSDFTNDKD